MKKVAILGSTGSVGKQTLEVIEEFSNQFKVVGLSCHKNTDLIKKQIEKFKPELVSIQDFNAYQSIKEWIQFSRYETKITHGLEGLSAIATQKLDLLIVATVGTIALYPTIEAIKNRTPIGLACKEILVSAGSLIMPLSKKYGAPLIPIDSEHAAVQQCKEKQNKTEIKNIILTASGGPFLGKTNKELSKMGIQDALNHPKWKMGSKISIDSATLMNKGLEVIEAHHLFEIEYSNIKVVVHPQSIVHGAIEWADGSIVAQLALPDMKIPIQAALTHPKRLENSWPKLSLSELKILEFQEPDLLTFPLLSFAYEIGKQGGLLPSVMNAANEAAVALFLNKKISFLDISNLVMTHTLKIKNEKNPSLDTIIGIDKETKEKIYAQY